MRIKNKFQFCIGIILGVMLGLGYETETRVNEAAYICFREGVNDREGDLPAADVQPDDRWIRVHDRLPETNDLGVAHILAYDRYEGAVSAYFLDESANYVGGSNVFVKGNSSAILHKVTHWQPLPDPPKEDDYERREESRVD